MSGQFTGRNNRRIARFAAGVAALGAVATAGGLASTALFTDQATVTSGNLSVGNVDISTNAGTPMFLNTSNMAPGDYIAQPVVVTNAGTLDYRYALRTVSADTDATQATLSVKVGGTCTVAGFAGDGTVLYGPGTYASAAGVNVFGSSAQGQQAGDRTLVPAANETLCVMVGIPIGAGNGAQSITIDGADFIFNAEQTKNNP